MIGNGLNDAFGTSLKRIISRSTSNRFKAFSVGTLVASALQSSTATCMIVSNFAGRSVITVFAAVALMLGADVGTTLAAQLMSLDLSWLVPVLMIVGFVTHKSLESSPYKLVSHAFIGIALVLLSLKMITMAAEPFKHSEAMQVLLTPLSDQPIMAVILSALLTWVVHSSLGMVLLFMGFVASGAVPLELGLFMILGANIGGTIAPVVMTMKNSPAARRVPVCNMIVKVIGVTLAFPFLLSIIKPAVEVFQADPARVMVNFHTAFNIGLGLSFLLFITPITKVSEWIIPDRLREDDPSLPKYLDPDARGTPAAAMAGAVRETLRICDIVQEMFTDTLQAMNNNDYNLVNKIHQKELVVDRLYRSIKFYLSRLSTTDLTEKESSRYIQILIFVTNLEHIGDIIDTNLMHIVNKKIKNQASFSDAGKKEIANIHAEVLQNINLAQNVFMTGNLEMAKELAATKKALRKQEMMGIESHFRRLGKGVAESVETTSLHLDILRDLRRINSYITLVAYPVMKEAEKKASKDGTSQYV